MAKPIPDMSARILTLDSGKRSIDLPVDAAGHIRRTVRLLNPVVTRGSVGDEYASMGFIGHAAVFNSRAWIGSRSFGFFEEMAPEAFNKTLGEADVRFLQNHDPNYVLARMAHTDADTLRLAPDNVGLAVDADMAPTSYARDLAILLERGDVTQMSFAFDMIGYEWREADDGSEVLRHTEVRLHDVSVVTYPAYADTDAGLRMDILAACRASGFEAVDISRLARRLADPDPVLIDQLRALALVSPVTAPAESTRSDDNAPATSTRDESKHTKLRLATLAAATDSLKEI